MQQMTLTLDLSALNPNQLKALLDLVDSFDQPYVIPTHESAEKAKHFEYESGNLAVSK